MVARDPHPDQITGLILAGGRGRRLGGSDKGLVGCAGRPLIAWVIDALAPQVGGGLLISANRNLATYRALGWPVVQDREDDFAGPLAGLASAMAAARTPWILVVPCDAPLIPADLATRLAAALVAERAELALADDGERLHPLHALLPVDLAPSLDRFLASGQRAVRDWYAQHHCAKADLSDQADAFRNLNTPADIAALRDRLAGRTE
ncbi:molybdenum cofactor guanylyltransferase MobA [Thioalkalicoccus limnaeus]|uniref:Molybdenum cofactor guanylyltransferase n=1 Tax=Thioalkalicoccus limnaeus TaxID=120681 RepID=A0ABV4BCN3_9GAMM